MPKQRQEIPISGVTIDRSSRTPVYKQLYSEFRDAILAGRFLPGQQIPPTRELAKVLKISRTTVLLAFDHLLLEGYIKGKPGAGTFISDEIPESLLLANFKDRTAQEPERLKRQRTNVRGSKLVEYLNRERLDYNKFQPFKPGVPDLNRFPCDIWSKLLAKGTSTIPKKDLGYSSSGGFKPLRKAIADYLRMARGVKCHHKQVIIINGAQQGVDIICRVLLEKGDSVGFEDPGYPDARNILSAAGMNIIPMPMDDEGMNFKNCRQEPALLYITPSHQYPLGVTMSLNRRLELLEYATSIGAWILEDDYDSEYRYNGFPLSALQGIDNSHSVIYMGTFSKVMFPGIRLGYVIVPEDLIEIFIAAKLLIDRNSPILEQAAMEKFIAEGHYGRHVRKMRVLYEQRKKVFYELVETYLSQYLFLHPTEAGLHTIAWLKQAEDDTIFSKMMFENHIIAPALSGYSITKKLKPALVLGYAAYSQQQIEATVKKMKKVLG